MRKISGFEFLQWIWNLSRRYKTLYVDIDKNTIDTTYIMETICLDGDYKIYITKNGYHLVAEFDKPQRGWQLLFFMLRLQADGMHVYNFLKKGYQTLFYIRRGKMNRRLIKEWEI
jgi:hypothetical protein